MNYSGILVMGKPHNIADIGTAINALDGAQVFQQEPDRGRLVAVLEADDIKTETELLRAIKQVPGVAAAEMVYHYFEDDREIITHIPEELDALEGIGAVPASLQDN